jgi:hypothetical protein
MKKLLFSALFLAISISLFSQKNIEKQARKEAKHYTKVLNLDEGQQIKLIDILQHKYQSIEDLSSMETSDPSTFRTKRRAVYTGTDGSIRLLLNREQNELFDVEKRRQRLANAERIQKLQAQGADQEDILDAQFGIKN